MKADNNKVISLTYQLRVDNYESEVLEEVQTDEPLIFLFGAGGMLPKFEENILGMEKGNKFQFKIDCENAYGEAVEDAVVDLPISNFEVDGEIDHEMLVVDNVIPMKDEEGNFFDGIIVEVNKDSVTIDFNHPFSGDDLYFQGEIVDIREASEEEIKQGFAEGEIIEEEE